MFKPLFGVAAATVIGVLATEDRRLDVLEINHESNLTDVTQITYPGYLFSDGYEYALAPETTQDPFFTSGVTYRQDVVEGQAGVSLTTIMKFVDVTTSQPVKNLWVSFWNSNADGVYSGVAGAETDATTDATFLRGLVQTDMYGLATFNTVFPGHYTGRTPHLNILAQYNGTYLDNTTYNGGTTVHVGEIFFDQDLIAKVAATKAYLSNQQNLTLYSDDKGLAEASNYDPIAMYSLTGSAVEDGIVA
ncbi:hypothetical protein PInf_018334 [Phytophthora infestans]|nr:hypothetical protein PInf_018334 [Phytophthora infestans]